jgi:hypothetical protein
MRRAGLAAALLPTIVFAGCFQSTVLVKVNADGSGTIETHTVMTSAALAQVRQLSGAFGSDAKPVELFSEQQAREVGSRMGDDITMISTRALKTADGEGREAVYAFRDVTKLRLSQTPAAPGGSSVRAGGLGLGAQGDAMTIGFSRNAAGNMVLTLHLGANPLGPLADQTGAGNAGRGIPMPADQLALMQPMLAGMRIALRVEPSGRLVKTSSPYVDGNIVTILDIDLDALLNDPAFKQLQTAKTSQESKDTLRSMKGIKLNLEPDITLEFAP